MRCGIPLLGDRVAPRCTVADGLMVVVAGPGGVTSSHVVKVDIASPLDLLAALEGHRIDRLICGGITGDIREVVGPAVADIVDNVACSVGELVDALERGVLGPGFGLLSAGSPGARAFGGEVEPGVPGVAAVGLAGLDCLRCHDRVCLAGRNCLESMPGQGAFERPEVRATVEAALDLAQEDERQLCRIAELVYFCLEMGYRRIGLAYCVEVEEPAEILSGVLRRFFEVVPVCCKVGGAAGVGDVTGREPVASSPAAVGCNPIGQAEVLNGRATDLNVAVGLCIGVDALFSRASSAPATTLFVKDRSLANNPIGALYSEYYLRESVRSPRARRPAGDRPAAGSSGGGREGEGEDRR